MTGDIEKGLGLAIFTSAFNGTSLVEALVSPVLGDKHPARNRASFDRYDDPRLPTVQSVQRAAVENGADAARGTAWRPARGPLPFLDGPWGATRVSVGSGQSRCVTVVCTTTAVQTPSLRSPHGRESVRGGDGSDGPDPPRRRRCEAGSEAPRDLHRREYRRVDEIVGCLEIA